MTTNREVDERVESLPQFSTTDRGSRMTSLRPGQPLGRLAPLVPRLLVAWALWALTSSVPFDALTGLAPSREVVMFLTNPITVAAAIVVALFGALNQTFQLHSRAREAFGQARVAALLTTVAVTGGFATSAGILVAWTRASDPAHILNIEAIATSPEVPLELGALIGAAFACWCVIALLSLWGAVAHARRRQHSIEDLRSNGTAFDGILSAVAFSHHWVHDEPMFRTETTYVADGVSRVIAARMRTSADRVPLVGSPMIVRTDGRGAIHVEPDATAEPSFEPEDKYRAPND
ncbi:MAG: hypothetical protein ABJB03_09935 [Rhodoglobus sp.]